MKGKAIYIQTSGGLEHVTLSSESSVGATAPITDGAGLAGKVGELLCHPYSRLTTPDHVVEGVQVDKRVGTGPLGPNLRTYNGRRLGCVSMVARF